MTALSPLSIGLINRSTVVSNADVKACAAALNVQLRQHFAPIWGVTGSVRYLAKPSPNSLSLWVLDDSDEEGALGYHDAVDTDDDGDADPYGRVFARTDQENGLNWTITASHEVLEMAGDLFVIAGVQVNQRQWTALEVCDAVEADADGYQVNGVWVSDFVTPAWYGMGTGVYDYRRLVTRPFQLRRGGYISLWSAETGWTQRTAQAVEGETHRARFAHRRTQKARKLAAANREITEAA